MQVYYKMNKTEPFPNDKTIAQQIDNIINESGDWRGETLSNLRTIIINADPVIIEEVKWKKPSNPNGVPVWSQNGIICIANILKKAVRLTFPKGAKMQDPKKLFNTRLDSKTVRATDFFEGGIVDKDALKALILQAVELNNLKAIK
jgi:hypothetical protein